MLYFNRSIKHVLGNLYVREKRGFVIGLVFYIKHPRFKITDYSSPRKQTGTYFIGSLHKENDMEE
jgi:hypothetical protein